MGAFKWIQNIFGKSKTKGRCPEEERCLELLRVVLDDQATEEESEFVHKHIDVCYKCYQNYDLENTIREALKRKVQNLKVPDNLVKEITNKIDLK